MGTLRDKLAVIIQDTPKYCPDLEIQDLRRELSEVSKELVGIKRAMKRKKIGYDNFASLFSREQMLVRKRLQIESDLKRLERT